MEILLALFAGIFSTIPVYANEEIIGESKPTVAVKTAEQADSLHLVATDKVQDPSYLGIFTLSRYYSITADQTDKLPYEKDIESMIMMNCGKGGVEGCKTTANGHILTDEDIGTLYSCPPSIPLGTKIRLVFSRGERKGVCHDRGGSIKGKRLDSFCGFGNQGVYNIRSGKGCYTGSAKIYIEK